MCGWIGVPVFVFFHLSFLTIKLAVNFQGEMLATSEQDFLNAHFKDHYFLIPIDYIMKHRRMVKERKLWVRPFLF